MSKPTLCIVWKDSVIYGDVTEGFFEWAEQAAKKFKLAIYSSRSKTPEGIYALRVWIYEQREKWRVNETLEFEFVSEKPPLWIAIHDRAICFVGEWSEMDMDEIINFGPRNQK